MDEKVSIIIPVYNAEKYIEKCLKSVVNQSYKNLEIIVINDGSIDNSLNLIKKLKKEDNRIIIINQKNMGVSIARNNGINNSTGDFISFIDSDDTIDENYIEKLVSESLLNNSDLIGSNICVVNKNHNFYPYSNDETTYCLFGNELLEKYLNFKISTAVWGKLFTKDLIGETRFEKIDINEDFIFSWNIIKKVKKYSQVNSTHYNYNIGISNSLSKHCFSQENMSMITHASNVLQDIKNNYPILLNSGINYFNACVLHNYLIYYKYIFSDNVSEIYEEQKLIMENFLSKISKIDNCLLLPENDINIDKIIFEVNNFLNNRKEINK